MFREYLPIEYLCIDIANNFGDDGDFKGDKDTFENRIQWVKTNYDYLEERIGEAEEIDLFAKGVMALRDVVKGGKTGIPVSLDSTCSGIQILSAITGCREGGLRTNLIDPNNRYDVYTDTTDEMNVLLAKLNKVINVLRKDAKTAMMTGCYGSSAEPREIFGELVDVFHEACLTTATGAFTLLKHLIKAWRPFAEEHRFILPDCHEVLLPTVAKVEKTIEINELKHKFTTYIEEIQPEKSKVSLAAHFTHALDSYLLRSVLRRTNYNTRRITNAMKLLDSPIKTAATSRMDQLVETWDHVGIADVLALHTITNAGDVAALPKAMQLELREIGNSMLKYGSFQTLTVHDAYRTHPNNCNGLRFAYKETMAQMADSDILNDWFIQVTGQPCKMPLYQSIAKEIRGSNYAIC